MKLTILGATGPTGLMVVRQALKQGHFVTAYVRQRGALPSDAKLKIMIGELDDTASMEKAIRGADAVISCLGVPLGLKTMLSVNFMARALPTIVRCMEAAGADRLVVLSALGVGQSKDKTSWLARLIYRLAMKPIFEDKQLGERALTASDLNWTLIYAAVLTNGRRTGAVSRRTLADIDQIPGLPKVSRLDVADVLLSAATTGWGSRDTVVITPQE